MGSLVGIERICRVCARVQAVEEFRCNRVRGVVRRVCRSCERARWRRWKRAQVGAPVPACDLPPRLSPSEQRRIDEFEAYERGHGDAHL